MVLHRLNRFADEHWLRRYRETSVEERALARALLWLYCGIISLLIPLMFFTLSTDLELLAIQGMLPLALLLIGLVLTGHHRFSVLVGVSGFWILTVVMTFSPPEFDRFEMYRATVVYLTIIFISALVVQRPIYTFIISGLSVLALWAEYFIRGEVLAPPEIHHNSSNYFVCSGLIVLALLMVNFLISRNNGSVQAAQAAAGQSEKQAMEMLHLRNYLKSVIDALPSAIISVDRNCEVLEWNRQAQLHLGVSREDAIGRNFVVLCPQLHSVADEITRSVHTGTPITLRKLRLLTDGNHRVETISLSPLETQPDGGAVIRLDDVTAQEKLQEVLIQSEKMMSIGGLAAGMAHEINNPLGGIIQASTVLLTRTTEDIPANRKIAAELNVDLQKVFAYLEHRSIPRMAENILQSGERAAEIVRSMLNFARRAPGPDLKVATELPDLIEQTLGLAATDYDMKKEFDFRHIRIIRNYDPHIPTVPCIPARLQQVLLNILKNAAEAMQEATDGGRMSEAPEIQIRLRTEGDQVVIEIADNGPGIPPEVRNRIFEPFFTTKPVGKGTGLGMSVSYFIITENHGGQISVSSSPGSGTSFLIRLPVFPDAAG